MKRAVPLEHRRTHEAMNIAVHIERLVMNGVAMPPRDRPRLQAAFETELARLVSEEGLSPALLDGGAVPSMRAGSIQLAGDGDVVKLAHQIARTVYGGLGDDK